MEIIKRGRIDNFARCEKCGTEMRYNANDLRWTHTEEDYYYVTCPVCGKTVWIERTPETDAMWASVHGKA